MNSRVKKYSTIVGAALVGVLAFSAISFAQSPDTDTSSAPVIERLQQGIQNGFQRGGPGGRGGPGEVRGERGERLAELAAAMGMTTEALQAALDGGQTLEEIAAANGFDLQAHALTQAQEHLAQAVADGKLTQEEADAKLAEIQTAIENGEFPGRRGFGPGHGARGERGSDLAEALGMTQEELKAAIQSGQTVEEIAAEKGVDLQAFFLTQAQERLTEAVAEGKLTQEEADAKLAEIQTAIENGEFPGPRGERDSRGPGRRGGPRGGQNGVPSNAPTGNPNL